jgi:cyclophilin family peptidyl-prolyl cis-trans isomerase
MTKSIHWAVLARMLAGGLCITAGICQMTPVAAAEVAGSAKPLTMSDVLAASKPQDWHALDPQNTLYLEVATGRVVIELAPLFAPKHAANIKALVREKYFDGLAFLRSQDNYVVQWGDPHADARAEDKDHPRSVGNAQRTLKAEFTIPLSKDLPFTRLPDVDGYAPEVGFSGDFWAARDPKRNDAWLTHCYGALGVGRDLDADSGGGTELYVVIGNAPRHLDRNITLAGRVVQGMELLSVLPRGTGPLGFYEKPEQRVPIKSIRIAADLPAAERTNLEVLRTDTPTFAALVESRRNRQDDWFKVPSGYVELCNVPIPVRAVAAPASGK